MSKLTVSSTRMTPLAAAIRLVLAGAMATSAGAALAQAASKETTLQEVTVVGTAETSYAVKATSTATKTDTLLRDTPQSITVVTKELIRDQNMQSIADALRYVPGIVTAQGEGNRDTAVFRGNASTSDFFMDGIRDDVQYYRDFYNIDSVEFLKGSNAMIFGRGGSGGVINRVSKTPSWVPVRAGSLTLGSYSNKRATVDVGQAVNDKFAVRINGMVEDSGSYRDGVTLERAGINPTLAFRAGRNTNVVVGFEHFRDDRVADRGVPSFAGRPYNTEPGAFFGNPEQSESSVRMNAFTAVVDHDFGGGLTLRNRTRWADYDKMYQNVYANGAVTAQREVALGAYRDTTLRTNFFNQTDLFYTLSTGAIKHKLAFGMELGNQKNESTRVNGTFAAGRTLFPVNAPRTLVPVTFTAAPGTNNDSEASVASVYLQDQIEFSPKWQAVLGLRYDRFNVEYNNKVTPTRIEVTDSPVSPRVGLIFKPVEAVSIYGSYSKAFSPRAGEHLASLTVTNRELDPEEFNNLELGAKWDVSPDLQATAAVYQLDRKNVVVTDPAQPLVSFLADGQTTKGLELGLSGKLTSAWSVMGGYAYQDAKLEANPRFTQLTGKTVQMVPKHTFALWNRFELNNQWAAGLGLSYRDSIYAAADNAVTLPGYHRVDAAVFYKLNKNYQLQLNVENLLDREYYASAHNNNNITPGSPRAVRVTLNASF